MISYSSGGRAADLSRSVPADLGPEGYLGIHAEHVDAILGTLGQIDFGKPLGKNLPLMTEMSMRLGPTAFNEANLLLALASIYELNGMLRRDGNPEVYHHLSIMAWAELLLEDEALIMDVARLGAVDDLVEGVENNPERSIRDAEMYGATPEGRLEFKTRTFQKYLVEDPMWAPYQAELAASVILAGAPQLASLEDRGTIPRLFAKLYQITSMPIPNWDRLNSPHYGVLDQNVRRVSAMLDSLDGLVHLEYAIAEEDPAERANEIARREAKSLFKMERLGGDLPDNLAYFVDLVTAIAYFVVDRNEQHGASIMDVETKVDDLKAQEDDVTSTIIPASHEYVEALHGVMPFMRGGFPKPRRARRSVRVSRVEDIVH